MPSMAKGCGLMLGGVARQELTVASFDFALDDLSMEISITIIVLSEVEGQP